MGDIADWTNDCLQDAYLDWMPVGDPYRPRVIRNRQPNFVTCSKCGRAGLQWKQFDGRWAVAEMSHGAPRHVCVSDEGFETID